MAKAIYRYLVKNDYADNADQITVEYHDAKKERKLAALPTELERYALQVCQLIDGGFSDTQLPSIDDERKTKVNSLNANLNKKEFQELWVASTAKRRLPFTSRR